ncbi:MAG: hypothetical protein ACJ8M1_06530 [Chthoniobacterales bacterium]
MTSELFIITPEISPGRGGLADHTAALLRQWHLTRPVTLVTAEPQRLAGSPWNVRQLGSDYRGILDQLPIANGTLFVQYSAYGFDRLGYPRDLLRALVDWRKCGAGRLVVMFHEIWTIWPITNKNFAVQFLHRRGLKRLLNVCDAVFTTTASQAEHLNNLCPAASVQVLPVGSNIARVDAGQIPRERGCAALFGLLPTRVRALEVMQRSLAMLAEAGRLSKIVTVGQGTDMAAQAEERGLLQNLNLSGGFLQHGPQSEQSCSEILSSASFGIFGQNELSCTKSGSFMACAAHELRIIARFADSAKPPPACWLVSPDELLGDIGDDELDRRAQCLCIWQKENSSWVVIARQIGQALRIGTLIEAEQAITR